MVKRKQSAAVGSRTPQKPQNVKDGKETKRPAKATATTTTKHGDDHRVPPSAGKKPPKGRKAAAGGGSHAGQSRSAAIAYLRQWKEDKQTWKFKKVRQTVSDVRFTLHG